MDPDTRDKTYDHPKYLACKGRHDNERVATQSGQAGVSIYTLASGPGLSTRPLLK